MEKWKVLFLVTVLLTTIRWPFYSKQLLFENFSFSFHALEILKVLILIEPLCIIRQTLICRTDVGWHKETWVVERRLRNGKIFLQNDADGSKTSKYVLWSAELEVWFAFQSIDRFLDAMEFLVGDIRSKWSIAFELFMKYYICIVYSDGFRFLLLVSRIL